MLEFPERGKKRPVRKATNCSLQSAGASGGNREAGSVTEARAIEFWRETNQETHDNSVYNDEVQYSVLLRA